MPLCNGVPMLRTDLSQGKAFCLWQPEGTEGCSWCMRSLRPALCLCNEDRTRVGARDPRKPCDDPSQVDPA